MTAVVPIAETAQRAPMMLRPVAPISEVIQQQGELRTYIAKALVVDRDYGTIPGVKKPSLLKPGAERINTAYGVMPRFSIISSEVDHHMEVQWHKKPKYGDAESGLSYGLYAYTVRCELVNRATGEVVADCIGACSSMESKYIDRPRDSQNTVLKMAEKGAYVGATLLAYGLSDQFTQDVEDTKGSYGNDTTNETRAAAPARQAAPSGSAKGPGDVVYPFGKFKGKRLGDLKDADLTRQLDWARATDAAKFADLIEAMELVLDSRRAVDPVEAEVTSDDESALPF